LPLGKALGFQGRVVKKLNFSIIFLFMSTFLIITHTAVMHFIPEYIIETFKVDTNHSNSLESINALIDKVNRNKTTIPTELVIETLEEFKKTESSYHKMSHNIVDAYRHFNSAFLGILLFHLVVLFYLVSKRKPNKPIKQD
jgi:predicted PurR-regulated permease PerM